MKGMEAVRGSIRLNGQGGTGARLPFGVMEGRCAICGERVAYGAQWAWRRTWHGEKLIFCSYGCMRRHERECVQTYKPAGKRGRKPKSIEERAAYLQSCLTAEKAALEADGLTKKERAQILKRRARHVREMEAVQAEMRAQSEDHKLHLFEKDEA